MSHLYVIQAADASELYFLVPYTWRGQEVLDMIHVERLSYDDADAGDRATVRRYAEHPLVKDLSGRGWAVLAKEFDRDDPSDQGTVIWSHDPPG